MPGTILAQRLDGEQPGPAAADLSDYAVIPLAVPPPPVDADRFRAYVQAHCDRCRFIDNAITFLISYARRPVIGGQTTLHGSDPRLQRPVDAEGFDWDPAFRHEFADLVAWFEALPFATLRGLDLVTQTADLPEHLDIFGLNSSVTQFRRFRHLEPMYYRVIFGYPDDAVVRNHSFYVTRELGGERHYVSLPSQTGAFALSSSIVYHSATHNPGHFKTTAAIFGILDQARHIELLRRSLAVHGDHAIRFADAGPVRGVGARIRPRQGARATWAPGAKPGSSSRKKPG